MEQVTPNEMYGIAKKFNEQLMAYPMHTHSAIVELVRCGMQHRNLQEQADDRDRQRAQQERMLDIQQQQVDIARAEQERRQALELAGRATPTQQPQ